MNVVLIRRPKPWKLVLASMCLLLAGSSLAAPSESEVKAAYLYNFARYVTWPDDAFRGPSDPIRICVVDDDAFLEVLQATVADKRVGERPVRAASGQSGKCQILFLKQGRAGEGGGHGVFTVSDREGFAAAGGIANFVMVGNKIRFEINTNAAVKAGLQVSSRLLRLAQIVE